MAGQALYPTTLLLLAMFSTGNTAALHHCIISAFHHNSPSALRVDSCFSHNMFLNYTKKLVYEHTASTAGQRLAQ